jgi:hypothetical protein
LLILRSLISNYVLFVFAYYTSIQHNPGMIMSIMFPPSKKKLVKVQFSIDDKARQRRVGSKHSLDQSDMFLNASLRAVKGFTEKLEYLEKNKTKFLADSKQQFNWKYKSDNYTYVLLIDENLGIPFGYEIEINNQFVQIIFNFEVKMYRFDICYDSNDKKIDKIAEEFLKSMIKENQYVQTDIHKGILGMKSLEVILKRIKSSYFEMEVNSIDDLIACFKQKIISHSAQIPDEQKERDQYHAFYLEDTANIAKYEKELDKLNGSNKLSLALAKMVGDKRALSKLDLFNPLRADRLLLAWLVLIIELTFIAIGLVIASFAFAFAFAKSK